MKLKYILPIAIIAVLFIASCKKKDNPLPAPVPVLSPIINSFAPMHAKGGDTIVITGTDFSTTIATNIVKINGKPATVITATATSLSVKVPSLSGTGNLSVTIGANTGTSTGKFGYDTVWVKETLVGTDVPGEVDGTYTTARFTNPYQLVFRDNGTLYVSDNNGPIRILDTAARTVSTLKDGNNNPYSFVQTSGISFSGDSIIYVVERARQCITKITATGSVVFAGDPVHFPGYRDGQGTLAKFSFPEGIVTKANGNLLVADKSNGKIRQITPSGYVSTITGAPGSVSPDYPIGLVFDKAGHLFISNGTKIYKMDTATNTFTLFAGQDVAGNSDGPSLVASFNGLEGMGIDGNDNLFGLDYDNHSIRKIDPSGNVSTIVTNLATVADDIEYITVDKKGVIYLGDYANNKVLIIRPQ